MTRRTRVQASAEHIARKPEKDDPDGMVGRTKTADTAEVASTSHAFSGALSAVLLARVRQAGGEAAVTQLLEDACSGRTLEYLQDVGNWISFDEAVALWEAGEAITRDFSFARHVGEDALKLLGGSATAATLRSLGSPEEHFRRVGVSSKRWSVAADYETIEVRPGYAEIRAVAAPGFPNDRHHCEWTMGLFTVTTGVFGLKPARVEHTACRALGAPECRYHVTWDPAGAMDAEDAQLAMLQKQLDALSQRLEGVFDTAADLISTGDLDDTLGRIADRAAHQVRAPKYLLAVRPAPGAELLRYAKGLDDDEARSVAERLFAAAEPPENWCVAEIRSRHREYGRLVAMSQEGAQFLPQERDLLELYARYAATALDSATALLEARTNGDEAQRRHQEARALLDLARHLASAGSSDQIAARLAETVPAVIDCDRVSVWIWDDAAGENVCRAVNSTGRGDEAVGSKRSRPSEVRQLAAWLEQPDPEPYFLDMHTSVLRGQLEEVGAVAAVSVPIATGKRFLGSVMVTVRERPERLADTPELRDRLSGAAAHAVIALENGRLVDHITHQASHDPLTGLANRLGFAEHIGRATETTDEPKPFALFYIDLDRFKPVNDEFGHEVGDSVLRAVAERLRNCARPDDTVARLGGDEFAVIVEAIDDASHLDVIGERFAKAFQAPFVVDGHKLAVRASIGKAVWPVDATDVDGLLREADTRMYRAKHRTRDESGRDSGGLPVVSDARPPSPRTVVARRTKGSADGAPRAPAPSTAVGAEAASSESSEHVAYTSALAAEALLREHPDALVCGLASSGVIVPLPPEVPLWGQAAIEGRALIDHVVAADRQVVIELWWRVTEDNWADAGAWKVRLLDRPERWVTLHFFDVRELYGVFLGILIPSDQPIAETHAGEEPSPPRPRQCTIVEDETGLVLDVDDAFTQVFGYSAADVLGQRVIEHVHPDDQGRAVEGWLKMVATRRNQQMRIRRRRKDGSWLWVDSTLHNFLNDQQRHHVLVEIVDVSAEMTARDEVEEREELLEHLIESASDGLLQLDTQRNVVFHNARLLEILDCPSRGEDVGHAEGERNAAQDAAAGAQETAAQGLDALMNRVTDEGRDAFDSALSYAFHEGADGGCEVEVTTHAGEHRRVLMSVRPLHSADGSVSGAVARALDVTDSADVRRELARGPAVESPNGGAATSAREGDLLSGDQVDALLAAHTRRHAGLAALGHALLRADDLGALLDEVVATVARTLDVELCAVVGQRPDEDALEELASVGRRVAGALPAGMRTQASYTLVVREPVVSDHLSTETRFDAEALLGEGMVSGLSAVIEAGGQPFGVLVADTSVARRFTEEEVEFLVAVANIVAVAAEREREAAGGGRAALHDPVTRLPNRALALDLLDLVLARRPGDDAEVAVLLLDLDRFSLINESLGHEAGDEVLLAVASRLRQTLRPSDTIARLGGDEFLVICESREGLRSVVALAERIDAVLRRPFALAGGEHVLTVSIGIAVVERPDDNSASLVRDAEAAMYRAKRRGPGRYEIFDPTVRAQVLSKLRTETELRRALERGELCVHYQPILDTASGRPVAAEALVRWEHPERGLVPPLEFIPIAEETGLIVELGRQVLEHACAQGALWLERYGVALDMYVNVSGAQMRDLHFPAEVVETTRRCGLPPEALGLEVTESTLIGDTGASMAVLKELSAQQGLRLVLDDFGTGYSSLSHLKRFPLSAVKADRSFVDGLGDRSEDEAIMKAIVEMCHALGLTVVAEGVETEAQHRAVRELGCEHVQGYLLCRPMPPADITAFLDERLHRRAIDRSP